MRATGRRIANHLFGTLNAAQRNASSLPNPGGGECVSVSDKLPPLLKLSTRTWGAAPSLTAEQVASMTGGGSPDRVVVVRQAFAPHDQAPAALADLVKRLGVGQLAVNAAVADPHHRMVVDEYVAQGGGYTVTRVGTDLLRWLRHHNVRLCLVPDVHTVHTLNSHAGASRQQLQSTNEVLMVAPTAFTFNAQAAQDNTFMHNSGAGAQGDNITQRVLREFAGLHHQLTEVAGVRVTLFEHALEHGTPDAVFPNNWFSTHALGEGDGGVNDHTLVLYPMKCPNRQAERRADILQVLQGRGFQRVHDMSHAEKEGKYFEGTGVLVLDRINGVVYCALSERADRGMAERWVQDMGYRDLVTFHSTDRNGSLVYHSNVMMAIGTDVAVVCSESVRDDKERQHLLENLRKRHKVVEISFDQMEALCGNVLELQDGRGLPVLAMSTRAYNAFTPDQRRELRRHVADLVHAPIDTLEFIGGGGVRCTLAELF